MSIGLPTYDGAVKAGRPYFFEIFTLANFLLLLLVTWRMTSMPLTTLGVIAPSIAGAHAKALHASCWPCIDRKGG